MLECLIIGDSIATGVAQHRPECVMYAKVGIDTHSWNNKFLYLGKDAKHTIISLGSNDNAFSSVQELETTRKNLTGKVTWIVPRNSYSKQEDVEAVAKKYKDNLLYINEVIRDGVHPTAREYRRLAEQTKP